MRSNVAERTAEMSEFCKRYHVTCLDLYGDAATADSLHRARHPDYTGQDTLTFVAELQPLPPGDYADAYFGLLESLERLFGQPVELATYSAIKNPYFRQIVEESRVNIYAA